ncbi:hypothetical protein [Pseudomonas sp. SK3(2021)]|uniref:hypothetical protein n=1 Tax=Pseudomonas sp. SK3(2021) TaxID=2841064 RepID=UPI0020784BC1|nr:hypothetical protein [Pseudomonas sp. SK3(2021)]
MTTAITLRHRRYTGNAQRPQQPQHEAVIIGSFLEQQLIDSANFSECKYWRAFNRAGVPVFAIVFQHQLIRRAIDRYSKEVFQNNLFSGL